jgi:predicted amidohydrolase
MAARSFPKPQMLLFPEFGTAGREDLGQRATTVAYSEFVPDCPAPNCTALNINPSMDEAKWARSSPALFRGSVLARNISMLVMINLWERLPCSPAGQGGCPSDGQFIYVTDVVFDESGRLVAKYRKSHPAFIFSVDKPPKAELVYYRSSFGPTFGFFICFDIAFNDPAVELVKLGIKHFAYAAAIGQIGRDTVAPAWSLLHNATLLLANNGANSSAAFVAGERVTDSWIIQVPNSPDTVAIAAVPVGEPFRTTTAATVEHAEEQQEPEQEAAEAAVQKAKKDRSRGRGRHERVALA